jgi:hypothetical protein
MIFQQLVKVDRVVPNTIKSVLRTSPYLLGASSLSNGPLHP